MTGGAAPAVQVAPSARALAEAALAAVQRAADDAVLLRGRFTVALSGGRTPRDLYAALASAGPAALPYDHVEIFWSDERAVPPDHAQSNYRLAWTTWLSAAPVRPAQVHRIAGELGAASAADRYDQELRDALGTPPRVDLILLGVGTDGHIASLFPDAPALETERWVAAASGPVAPRQRITMTLRAIRSAGQVLVLAAGAAKAAIVRRSLEGAPSPAVPASLLRTETTLWMLDRQASGLLRVRSPMRAARGSL